MAVADERPVGFGRMKRKEDPRFVRGQGHYVDDVVLPAAPGPVTAKVMQTFAARAAEHSDP